MAVGKRFAKRMLKATRLSIEDALKVDFTDVLLQSNNTDTTAAPPAISNILLLREKLIATIHLNLLKLWAMDKKDGKDFFRPRAYIELENLHHVIVVPILGDLVLLHDIQSVWVMTYYVSDEGAAADESGHQHSGDHALCQRRV
jgi:hypothetical protein